MYSTQFEPKKQPIAKDNLIDNDEVLGYDSEDNGKPIRTKSPLVPLVEV